MPKWGRYSEKMSGTDKKWSDFVAFMFVYVYIANLLTRL